MSELIWRDIRSMGKTLKIYTLFFAFYLALAAVGLFRFSFAAAMVTVVMVLLPLGTFSQDLNVDKPHTTVPGRQVAAARYCFVLLMALLSAAFGLSVCVFLSFANPAALTVNLSLVLTALGVGLLMVDILLPLLFKLGMKRARPYLYGIILLPILLLFGAYNLEFFNGAPPDRINVFSVSGLMASVLFLLADLTGLGASFLLSRYIVGKKER